VAEKMFASLAKAKINIHSITSSQISISCVVDETQAEKALQAVCAAFELDKPTEQRSS
jgi:aspartate kinase